jgi:hypothetical protein
VRKDRLGDLGSEWDNTVEMGLKEVGCENSDWIHLAQDRVQRWAVVKTVMKLRVP